MHRETPGLTLIGPLLSETGRARPIAFTVLDRTDEECRTPRYEARLAGAWRTLLTSGDALGREGGRPLGE